MKKFLLITTSMMISLNAIADTCPSIKMIKSSNHPHWKAFDSDNGKPLSITRTMRLKNEISEFVLAEWSSENHKNTVHCYYKNAHGSTLEAYFARESTSPATPSRYWYNVTGLMQCAASADKCQFQILPEMKKQFASKNTSEA